VSALSVAIDQVDEFIQSRLCALELGNQELGIVRVIVVLVTGVGEVDLVAFRLELLFEQQAVDGGMGGILLGFALDGRLVLGRIVEEDRGVAAADVCVRGILFDPVEQFGTVIIELLKL